MLLQGIFLATLPRAPLNVHLYYGTANGWLPFLVPDTVTRLTCQLGYIQAPHKRHSFHREFPCAKHVDASQNTSQIYSLLPAAGG